MKILFTFMHASAKYVLMNDEATPKPKNFNETVK